MYTAQKKHAQRWSAGNDTKKEQCNMNAERSIKKLKVKDKTMVQQYRHRGAPQPQ
jgi:uncharacterized membrane protein YqiK